MDSSRDRSSKAPVSRSRFGVLFKKALTDVEKSQGRKRTAPDNSVKLENKVLLDNVTVASLEKMNARLDQLSLSDCGVLFDMNSENLDPNQTSIVIRPPVAAKTYLQSSNCERFKSSSCCTSQSSSSSPSQSLDKSDTDTLPSYPVERIIKNKSFIFIDAHCHLDLTLKNYNGSFSDFRKQYAHEFPPSYRGCVAVFCYPETFRQESLYLKFLTESDVWASFGCHPKKARSYNDAVDAALCKALEHPAVRAVGEIGLDYSKGNMRYMDIQKRVFKRQLSIAVNKNLPLVIHCRDAYTDCLQILKQVVPKYHKIHLHCFTSSWSWAVKYLDEFPNLCIGLTNLVTFPDAKVVHNVAKKVPLSRLLLETDAPYFVPYPMSHTSNTSHPGMAIHVAAQVASIKNVSFREVMLSAHANTVRTYNL